VDDVLDFWACIHRRRSSAQKRLLQAQAPHCVRSVLIFFWVVNSDIKFSQLSLANKGENVDDTWQDTTRAW
jgi:hypothetical protein